jgi:hypothetical protein
MPGRERILTQQHGVGQCRGAEYGHDEQEPPEWIVSRLSAQRRRHYGMAGGGVIHGCKVADDYAEE